MKELNHSRLALPPIKELHGRGDLEVWDNDPDPHKPHHVVLWLDGDGEDSFRSVDLIPSEARTLAALLLNAAEHQERRAALKARETGK